MTKTCTLYSGAMASVYKAFLEKSARRTASILNNPAYRPSDLAGLLHDNCIDALHEALVEEMPFTSLLEGVSELTEAHRQLMAEMAFNQRATEHTARALQAAVNKANDALAAMGRLEE